MRLRTTLTGTVSLLVIAGLGLGMLSAPIPQYNFVAWGRDSQAKQLDNSLVCVSHLLAHFLLIQNR